MPDPVLIAGAGPTGLTAALELSRFGIPVRLIDRLEAPATTSRALGVQARTLELFDQRGLAEKLIGAGNPAPAANIYAEGRRLARLDLAPIDSRHNYILLVSQAETERVLREAVAAHGVAVERGTGLIGIAQDPLSVTPSPVRAVLRHADGRIEQTEAPWLISAEGAHSLVRTTLDLQFEGETLPDDYALGDFHADGALSSAELHLFSSAHGFAALFPLGEGHFRLIANLPGGRADRHAPPTLDELQGFYDERAHLPLRLHDLVWSSWFRINSRMVGRLKAGRLLLGGDSAHIHSPAGGQGMNTGIQDMINLAWKLAFVMKGESPAALLDTYEQDRLPVMRHLLSTTERATDVIGSENPLVRGLFNRLAPWIGGAGLVQATAIAQISQIALNYRGGPLSANHAHTGGLEAGDRVPDFAVRVREGESWREARLAGLLDPSRFVLLVVHPEPERPGPGGVAEAVQPWVRMVALVDIAPAIDEGARSRFQAAFGRSAGVWLVRPDAYVGLAAGEHAGAGNVAAYCRHWLSRGA